MRKAAESVWREGSSPFEMKESNEEMYCVAVGASIRARKSRSAALCKMRRRINR